MKLITDCDCSLCQKYQQGLRLSESEMKMLAAPIHGHPTLLGFIGILIVSVIVISLLSYHII